MENIKVIGFDADDTLWINEPYYREAEAIFCKWMESYGSAEEIAEELFKTEINNLTRYGYGAKGFTLSMLETALKISNKGISAQMIEEIMKLGTSLLEKPVQLMENIAELLENLKSSYQLVVATKGDLLDQQRKLKNSGLIHYFHHVEIMSDKKEENYLHLFQRLEIKAEEFLMVGNSLKSDILPVISLGAKAVHIPYHITWKYEHPEDNFHCEPYFEIKNLSELIQLLPRK